MNKLFEFLQEENGGYSSIRVFSCVSIICMAIDWMHAVWFGSGVYKPDPSLLALVLGPITAKVVQKKFEEKPTPAPSQEGSK